MIQARYNLFAASVKMLEALAAVSLASNVLQFVEFLAKVVSKSSEIRQHGATILNEEIEIIMTDLTRMMKELEQSATQEPATATAFANGDQVKPLFPNVYGS